MKTREIQRRDNKGVSKTTVRRHLDKMVAQRILVRHPKVGRDPKTGRRYNKGPYGLHRKKWAMYLLYLMNTIQRLSPESKHLFFKRFGASLRRSLIPVDNV
jgi:predicted ArsR family transcriptional regulator